MHLIDHVEMGGPAAAGTRGARGAVGGAGTEVGKALDDPPMRIGL